MLLQSKFVLVLFLLESFLIFATQKAVLNSAMKFESGNGKIRPRILSNNEYHPQPKLKHFGQQEYLQSDRLSRNQQHPYEPRPRDHIQYNNFVNDHDQNNFVANPLMERRNLDFQGAYEN